MAPLTADPLSLAIAAMSIATVALYVIMRRKIGRK